MYLTQSPNHGAALLTFTSFRVSQRLHNTLSHMKPLPPIRQVNWASTMFVCRDSLMFSFDCYFYWETNMMCCLLSDSLHSASNIIVCQMLFQHHASPQSSSSSTSWSCCFFFSTSDFFAATPLLVLTPAELTLVLTRGLL